MVFSSEGSFFFEMQPQRPVCLAIIGSRSYDNYLAFKQHVAEACAIWDIVPTSVVSGGATGVDTLAAMWAEKHNLPMKVHAPATPMLLEDDDGDADDPVIRTPQTRQAFLERNRKIIEDADYVIAFPSGTGSGTQHAMSIAEQLRKPMQIFRIA